MEAGTEDYEIAYNGVKKHPMFKGLEKNTIHSILKGLKLEHWERDNEFYSTNETFRRFHIILKGRVKIFQIDPVTTREFTLFILTKDDVFDVITLLDGLKHTTHFKTLDEVTALCVPMEKARSWVQLHPEINKTLMPYLASRMRLLEINLTDNVLSDIPTRLAKLILHNIDESSQKLQLINDLPNDEIASLVGSTRAVVNRHLQSLKQEGILELQRRKTQVKNIKALIKKIESRF